MRLSKTDRLFEALTFNEIVAIRDALEVLLEVEKDYHARGSAKRLLNRMTKLL